MSSTEDTLWNWLERPLGLLTRQAGTGNLAHALLISGQAATGKSFFARTLCRYLLCKNPGELMGCGECSNCHLSDAGTHPDFALCAPLEDARLIRVDQIRSLTEWLAKTAQLGGRQVALVDPADTMNAASANALLKSLEEPAANTFLILVTNRPASLLPTIRSRCQKLVIDNPNPAEAQAFVKSKLGDNQAIDALLKAAQGRPLRAVQLAEQATGHAELLSVLEDVWRGSTAAHQAAAKLLKTDPEIVQTLDSMHLLMASIIRFLCTGETVHLAYQGGHSLFSVLVKNFEKETSTKPWYAFLDELLLQRRAILSTSNPNLLLILEKLLVAWHQLTRGM